MAGARSMLEAEVKSRSAAWAAKSRPRCENPADMMGGYHMAYLLATGNNSLGFVEAGLGSAGNKQYLGYSEYFGAGPKTPRSRRSLERVSTSIAKPQTQRKPCNNWAARR